MVVGPTYLSTLIEIAGQLGQTTYVDRVLQKLKIARSVDDVQLAEKMARQTEGMQAFLAVAIEQHLLKVI